MEKVNEKFSSGEKLKNDFLFGNGRRGENRFKKRLRKLPSNSSRFSLIES